MPKQLQKTKFNKIKDIMDKEEGIIGEAATIGYNDIYIYDEDHS